MQGLIARLKKLERFHTDSQNGLHHLSDAELYSRMFELHKKIEPSATSDEFMAIFEVDFFVTRMIEESCRGVPTETYKTLHRICKEIIAQRDEAGDTNFAERIEEKLRTTSLDEFNAQHEEALEMFRTKFGL